MPRRSITRVRAPMGGSRQFVADAPSLGRPALIQGGWWSCRRVRSTPPEYRQTVEWPGESCGDGGQVDDRTGLVLPGGTAADGADRTDGVVRAIRQRDAPAGDAGLV